MFVPINGIIRFSDSFLQLGANSLDDAQKKLCRMINSCGKLLMCHTQDLLDNKLLDGGTIEPMVCTADLKQTIEDVI